MLGLDSRLSYLGTLALCSIPPAKLTVLLFPGSCPCCPLPGLLSSHFSRSDPWKLKPCHLRETLADAEAGSDLPVLCFPPVAFNCAPRSRASVDVSFPSSQLLKRKNEVEFSLPSQVPTEMAWQVTEGMGSVNDWRE